MDKAAEIVGGAVLSSAFQVFFDRVASFDFLKYFRKRKRDGKTVVEKLKTKLKVLEEVLDDPEKQQITKESMKNWVDDLKDVVYQAGDLLNQIETKVQVSTRDSLFDADMVSEIQEIFDRLDRLEDFAKESKGALDLKVSGVVSEKRWPSTSFVDESHAWGRDEEKEKIIRLLLSDSDEILDVISIVGMGGLGKTTLAQLVYNDVRVLEHFDTKSWACVPDDFDVFGVTKTILEQVSRSNYPDTKDLNRLQVKLKESLTGKKFLIVLDDVWNENRGDWDLLKTPFTAGKSGSKIIVTTRNFHVASIMGTGPVHHLLQLSDDACWSLFAKIAFQKGDFSAHRDLEKIGKEIVKKRCKGLPLAAKTLAGLLCSNLNAAEWNRILNSDIWKLPQKKDDILPVLRLSYYYLPSYLKQCFAYCSTFPEGYEYEQERIVLLWIAQNFVSQVPNSEETSEDIGRKYFCELQSRYFFQPSGGNKSSFVMHDLVHELAQVAGKIFFNRFDGTEQQNISTK